jgi:hypothetical protein
MRHLRHAAAVLFALVLLPSASAQDKKPLTEAEGWRTSAVFGLQGSQAAYSNWSEGGLDALSASANLNGAFARLLGRIEQNHNVRLAFGVLKQDTLDLRKADDVLRYAGTVQYRLGAIRPTLALELRTQFAKGFDYNPEPGEYVFEDFGGYELPTIPGNRVQTSAFFAPAHITISAGATYEPVPWFKTRLGLGLQETVVRIERLRPLYGNRLNQPIRTEAGLESVSEFRKEVFENVLVASRLGLFAAFGDADYPDAFFENSIQMKVNSVLSVQLAFDALLDRDVSSSFQLREALSVGLSFALL